MCKNMHSPGGCQYGKECIYAHSKQQLRTCKFLFCKILAVTDPVPLSAVMAYQKMEKIKQNLKNEEHRKAEEWRKEVEKKPKVDQQFIFGDDDFRDPYGGKHSKTL
jgi:hypothetical protein